MIDVIKIFNIYMNYVLLIKFEIELYNYQIFTTKLNRSIIQGAGALRHTMDWLHVLDNYLKLEGFEQKIGSLTCLFLSSSMEIIEQK